MCRAMHFHGQTRGSTAAASKPKVYREVPGPDQLGRDFLHSNQTLLTLRKSTPAIYRPTMQFLRMAIISFLSMLLAVGPAAAAFVPCCCTRPVEQPKQSCCQTKEQESCCAVRDTNDARLKKRGCCCFEQVPARFPDQRPASIGSIHTLLLACPSLPIFNEIDAVPAHQVAQNPDFPARPSLSILYCIWLK